MVSWSLSLIFLKRRVKAMAAPWLPRFLGLKVLWKLLTRSVSWWTKNKEDFGINVIYNIKIIVKTKCTLKKCNLHKCITLTDLQVIHSLASGVVVSCSVTSVFPNWDAIDFTASAATLPVYFFVDTFLFSGRKDILKYYGSIKFFCYYNIILLIREILIRDDTKI